MQKKEITGPYLLHIRAAEGIVIKVCVRLYGDVIKLWLKRGRKKRMSSRVGKRSQVMPS